MGEIYDINSTVLQCHDSISYQFLHPKFSKMFRKFLTLSAAAVVLLVGLAVVGGQQQQAPKPQGDDSTDFISKLQLLSPRMKQALSDIISSMIGILSGQYSVSFNRIATAFSNLATSLGADIEKMSPSLKANFTNFVTGLQQLASKRGPQNVTVADLSNVNGVFIGDMEEPFRAFLMKTYSKAAGTAPTPPKVANKAAPQLKTG